MLRHPKLIVVPVSLKTLVLEDCHDAPSSGHLDFKRTLARVEAKYYWEGIYSEVKRHCDNCQDCYRKKPSRTKTQGEIESIVISEPWNTINLDFIGPTRTTAKLNRYIIVLRDHATGWTEARATCGHNFFEARELLDLGSRDAAISLFGSLISLWILSHYGFYDVMDFSCTFYCLSA